MEINNQQFDTDPSKFIQRCKPDFNSVIKVWCVQGTAFVMCECQMSILRENSTNAELSAFKCVGEQTLCQKWYNIPPAKVDANMRTLEETLLSNSFVF